MWTRKQANMSYVSNEISIYNGSKKGQSSHELGLNFKYRGAFLMENEKWSKRKIGNNPRNGNKSCDDVTSVKGY